MPRHHFEFVIKTNGKNYVKKADQQLNVQCNPNYREIHTEREKHTYLANTGFL
jgi:hypothetical protein